MQKVTFIPWLYYQHAMVSWYPLNNLCGPQNR